MLKKKNNFLLRWLSVLGATCITDFVWTQYIATVAGRDAILASFWSVLVIVLGAYVVVSYVEDKRLIFPAAIGAFIGTYLGT